MKIIPNRRPKVWIVTVPWEVYCCCKHDKEIYFLCRQPEIEDAIFYAEGREGYYLYQIKDADEKTIAALRFMQYHIEHQARLAEGEELAGIIA